VAHITLIDKHNKDLQAIVAAIHDLSGGGGGGAVSSVFGRTGAVTAQAGDYSAFYAPLAHPLLDHTVSGLTTGHLLQATGANTFGFGPLPPGSIPGFSITYAQIQEVAGLSVLGRNTDDAGMVGEITANADAQVLRRSGDTIGFGALALDVAGSVSGTLQPARGGTGLGGVAPFGEAGAILYSSAPGVLLALPPGSPAQVLTHNGTAPFWNNASVNWNDISSKPAWVDPVGVRDPGMYLRANGEGNAYGWAYVTFSEIAGTASEAQIPPHNLLTKHTVSGLTTGHVLRATGATSFGFGQIGQAGLENFAVTYAKFQEVAGLSVVGRAAEDQGVVDAITAVTDGNVLRRSGNTIGFGQLPLDIPGSVSGTLPTARGGTGLGGVSPFGAAGAILYSTSASALTALAAGTTGQVLSHNGTAPFWTQASVTWGNITGLPAWIENVDPANAGRYLRHNGANAKGWEIPHLNETQGSLNPNRVSPGTFQSGDYSFPTALYANAIYATSRVQAGDSGGVGRAALASGGGSQAGYIEWIKPDGVRLGYIGWETGSVRLQLENSVPFTVVGGVASFAGGATAPQFEVTGDTAAFRVYGDGVFRGGLGHRRWVLGSGTDYTMALYTQNTMLFYSSNTLAAQYNNSTWTMHAHLSATSATFANLVTCQGNLSVDGAINEAGYAVAKVIVSTAAPSGSAPNGTFWAQVV
jgi:hypothetical protein